MKEVFYRVKLADIGGFFHSAYCFLSFIERIDGVEREMGDRVFTSRDNWNIQMGKIRREYEEKGFTILGDWKTDY